MSKKFPPVTSRDVIKVLLNLGYKEANQKGSHRQFSKEKSAKVTVPDHGSKQLPDGTLSSIWRQMGITKPQFHEILKGL